MADVKWLNNKEECFSFATGKKQLRVNGRNGQDFGTKKNRICKKGI